MIVVKNALAIIEANDDLDQAKVLRKAELNPSFFANFAKSKTGNMTLESVQKLAYGLSVPSVALLLSSDTRCKNTIGRNFVSLKRPYRQLQ